MNSNALLSVFVFFILLIAKDADGRLRKCQTAVFRSTHHFGKKTTDKKQKSRLVSSSWLRQHSWFF